MLISKFIDYALIHLLNLGVPSALLSKTFNWMQVTFKLVHARYTKSPGGMQGSKPIQLV